MTRLVLDGRDAEARNRAWAGADIFCSLVDNIQETFGISPIEAMAAGLPAVVSDWNGYKETVRDGVDGFRIPTALPRAGLGVDLAVRHATGVDDYDMYIGQVSAVTAIDIDAAANAFRALFDSPDLRRKMGDSGRARVRETFDWLVVIPQYEALWGELAAMRAAAPDTPGCCRLHAAIRSRCLPVIRPAFSTSRHSSRSSLLMSQTHSRWRKRTAHWW